MTDIVQLFSPIMLKLQHLADVLCQSNLQKYFVIAIKTILFQNDDDYSDNAAADVFVVLVLNWLIKSILWCLVKR